VRPSSVETDELNLFIKIIPPIEVHDKCNAWRQRYHMKVMISSLGVNV